MKDDGPHLPFSRNLQLQRLFEEAMNAYFRALRLKPNDPNIHLDVGASFLTHLHNKDRTLFHFKKSLELNPNHPGAKQLKNTLEILENGQTQ